jgi:hypothetical protein
MSRRMIVFAMIAIGMSGASTSAAADDPHPHVVVVELFTSQGCSSCPPADRLLTKLGGERMVIPLAYHVDFWNYIGWTDPFSSHAWTERQTGYARRFGLSQLSTPQAVVDGGAQVIGSDEPALRAAIAAAAAKPAGDVALMVTPAASSVRVDADVALPETLRSKKLDLMIAVFETGLVTPVGKGENGGRTLQNDYVVRLLVRAARLAPGGPEKSLTSKHGETLSLDKKWDRARLGVAAFLQDPATLEIRGAAMRTLAPPAAAAGAGGD